MHRHAKNAFSYCAHTPNNKAQLKSFLQWKHERCNLKQRHAWGQALWYVLVETIQFFLLVPTFPISLDQTKAHICTETIEISDYRNDISIHLHFISLISSYWRGTSKYSTPTALVSKAFRGFLHLGADQQSCDWAMSGNNPAPSTRLDQEHKYRQKSYFSIWRPEKMEIE